jgi:hypothetical protein
MLPMVVVFLLFSKLTFANWRLFGQGREINLLHIFVFSVIAAQSSACI